MQNGMNIIISGLKFNSLITDRTNHVLIDISRSLSFKFHDYKSSET